MATVLRMIEVGMSAEEILADYPALVPEDIEECLRFSELPAAERGPSPPQP